MRLFIIVCPIVISIFGLNAQPTCLPSSPANSTYPVVTTTLENLFIAHKPRYTESAYNSIKQEIERCNNATELELIGLISQMSNLSHKYQEVLSYKDVSGLKNQIRDLEESLKKSRVELEQNLGYVKHTGIFAVLLENVDIYEDKSSLIGKANAAIVPVAVEDLVGVHIRRSTQVQAFEPVRDVVQVFVSGEVKSEKEYFNQPNYQKNYFLYVTKVSATPLKKEPSGPVNTPRAIVINLERDSDFRSRLRDKRVDEENIERIVQGILPYLADVHRENVAADTRQDETLRRGTEEISRIKRDIAEIRQRLNTRSFKIESICKELRLFFNPNDIDEAANLILQTLRQQIQELTTRWTATKEREIIIKEVRVFIEGSPARHLALEAINTCKQFEQSYGKVDRIRQITEVESNDLLRFEADRTLTVYRNPQRLWAYPIPLDDGSFKLGVMAQFKITGQQRSKSIPKDLDPPVIKLSTEANQTPTHKPLDKKWIHEPEMVLVEGGSFLMGCTSEQGRDCDNRGKNTRVITLSDYYIGKTEVTQAQWKAVMGRNPSSFITCGDPCPVENISWIEVQDFLKKLNKITGRQYRLPTEAEWEYAARGGKKSKNYKYAGGMTLNQVAWNKGNSGNHTHPVAKLKANELGLFDMSGNVWEWCSDWYEAFYTKYSLSNPKGPATGTYRVYRSGSWNRDSEDCQVSSRYRGSQDFKSKGLGFRIALSR